MDAVTETTETKAGDALGATKFVPVCKLEDIVPSTGCAAMVDGVQVAVVRSPDGSEVFALGNFDPFSKAFVIARGIVGSRDGVLKIASPIYKQNFDLRTGVCLDDASHALPVFPVRIEKGIVLVAVPSIAADEMSAP